jgi:hypothetical protein
MELAKSVLLRDSPIAFRRRLIFTEAEPRRRTRFLRGDDCDSTGLAREEQTGAERSSAIQQAAEKLSPADNHPGARAPPLLNAPTPRPIVSPEL